MSYWECLACKQVGTEPERGVGIRVVNDPAVRSGAPTIENHGLEAEFVTRRVLRFGVASEMEGYQLTREEVLVACWWSGTYGSRRLREALGEWAGTAGTHLWYRCISIPDPPTLSQVLALRKHCVL